MEENIEKNKSFSFGCIEATRKYAKKLGFDTIFNRFKKKGDKLSNLVSGLVTHKMHFSKSINDASDWLNEPHIRQEFNLNENVPKTFYRTLETVGCHEKSILTLLQNRILELYPLKNTDSNMDWSSIVLYGSKAELGEYGYSRDHRPDKKQITFGVSQFRSPINIPFALSIEKGNVPDKIHFEKTFKRTVKALNPESLIIVDRGANTKNVKSLIRSYKHHYLCAASLSSKNDFGIKSFEKTLIVEEKDGKKIWCQKSKDGEEYSYLFLSEKLYEDMMNRKRRHASKAALEGARLEQKLTSGRKQKAKKTNLLSFIAEVKVNLQKKLSKLSTEELAEQIFRDGINGREGYFLLKSSKNLTEVEALAYYRSRDTIEKLIDSLKNTIRIKPVRVWTDNAIKGAIIIGFLAQVILALMQYDNEQLRKMRPKTLLNSLRNLTLTLRFEDEFKICRILSNIDLINRCVFEIY